MTEEPRHPCYRGMRIEGSYAYFFFVEEVDGYFEDWVARNEGLVFTGRYRFRPERWQRFASGCRVGSFTLITLSGEKSPPASDSSTVFLRKGIAFGSGIHPTTRAVVLAIEELLSRKIPKIVVDCGTGSGILSIIAAKMGVPLIVAVDISRVALREAVENASTNGVLDNICFVLGRDLSIVKPGRVDLLMMNLEWPALIKVIRQGEWARCKNVIVSGYPPFMSSVFRQLILRVPHEKFRSFKVEGWEALMLEIAKNPPEPRFGG